MPAHRAGALMLSLLLQAGVLSGVYDGNSSLVTPPTASGTRVSSSVTTNSYN